MTPHSGAPAAAPGARGRAPGQRSARRTPARGLRVRLTVTAALLVGLGLALGVPVVANLLLRSLTSSLVSQVSTQASDIAGVVASSGPETAALRVQNVSAPTLVQLYGPSGRLLVGSSAQGTDLTPSSVPYLAATPGAVTVRGARWFWIPGDVIDPVQAASAATWQGTTYVVVASVSQTTRHEAASLSAKIMMAGTPVAMTIAAAAAWWFVSRTLAPVERIRARVEHIGRTPGRSGDRVPVPETDDEIARLARTMNAMLDRLERSAQAQRRFVADASHELRSPLAVLRTAVDLTAPAPAATSPAPTSPETAEQETSSVPWTVLQPLVSAEVTRMQQLVDDLLLLSRADAGQPSAAGPADRSGSMRDPDSTSAWRDVDLDALADDEARRIAATANEIRVRVDAHPARVRGDEAALTRLLRNLVDNAVRHARSEVVIAVRAPAGADLRARVVVDDDGAGIPIADRARVFERFVRLDESRSRDSGGSGLGLSIVREIAAQHGGAVHIESSPSGGARLVVELPAESGEPLPADQALPPGETTQAGEPEATDGVGQPPVTDSR